MDDGWVSVIPEVFPPKPQQEQDINLCVVYPVSSFLPIALLLAVVT